MKHKGISQKELKKRLDAIPPNPGSEEAEDLGCNCPVMDNNYGNRGSYYGDGIWITTADCPLHGMTAKQAADAKQKAEVEKPKVKTEDLTIAGIKEVNKCIDKLSKTSTSEFKKQKGENKKKS